MEALKKSYKSYLVALLVVMFIGIAGGFTNAERGRWVSADGCSVSKDYDKVAGWNGGFDPDKAAEDLMGLLSSGLTEQEYCVTHHGGTWVTREKRWLPSVKGTSSYRINSDSRTVFDPKGTALFSIAGAVVVLVGLEAKRKKRG